MKSKLLTVLAILVGTLTYAQEGIQFSKGSWAEIIELAQKEQKSIFMDCYTTWCGPCKKLSKKVFPVKEVGDYFNEKFISVKVDMEKGEGIQLKEDFSVSAFPTLLFFDSNGLETHRIVGFKSPERLIEEAKKSQSGKNYGYYKNKYAEGERSIEFIYEYLKNLGSAGKLDEAGAVVEEFLKTIAPEDYYKIQYWSAIRAYINDGNSEVIKYIHNNPKVFNAIYGTRPVELKLYRAFSATAKSFSTKEGDKTIVDFEQYEAYLNMLKEMQVKDIPKIKRTADMQYALATKNWEVYLQAVNDIIKENESKSRAISTLLWNYAMKINSVCDDMKVRKVASKWCQIAMDQKTISEKSKENLRLLHEELLGPKKEKIK
ncbi:thioredoxin fold domain-containing protein [Tamlana sp. 2201CG12-4]|uniref:thioredoxin family protein n=1 Tax=Tamlana sp. 2201CG12-4 TaxID=3112582 RepID=UPI002DBDECA4|nr:thioredoxin fold domain-containing protein [Tamlana sp. 2201CG12-4]MEC3906748.1 thioredoxin fold domain-containing protein [Tamlana sp. 2201CG12-4]